MCGVFYYLVDGDGGIGDAARGNAAHGDSHVFAMPHDVAILEGGKEVVAGVGTHLVAAEDLQTVGLVNALPHQEHGIVEGFAGRGDAAVVAVSVAKE